MTEISNGKWAGQSVAWVYAGFACLWTFASVLQAGSHGPVGHAEVDQIIEQKLNDYLSSPAFDQRVEEAIDRYVKRQQEEAARKKQAASETAMKNLAPVDPGSDYIKGDPKAQFTLIEYSDFECPYCKTFHRNAQAFMDKHPEVNWVYRHFPLAFHNPGAQQQAEAVECAGAQGGHDAFWMLTDAIFNNTRSGGKGLSESRLMDLAQAQGLDMAAFQSCLASSEHASKVKRQHQGGLAAGVTGTPGSFLVNHRTGKMVSVHGAQPVSALEKALSSISQE